MKKLMMTALAAIAAAMTGCQTRVQIERDEPTKILPKQEVREFNGTNILITTDYFVPPAHYCVTARSPLFAKESVARFAADVGENGTWSINADGYSRDLSTNAVGMVKEMFAGGANLATAIGEAYVKIAGGGAQASTVLSSAQKIYEYFTSKGGDASKATVSTTADNKVQVTDGSTCVECDAAGNCTECSTTAK
jgi:hypothetical protein